MVEDLIVPPAPVWEETGNGTPVVLPPANPQPGVFLESPSGDLLLSLEGADGAQNQVTDGPALPAHEPVRVRIVAGAALVDLPQTDLTVVDHECLSHTLLLPAFSLLPGQDLYLWVTADGSTWWGNAGQNEPDFSSLARGSALAWVPQRPELKVEVVAEDLQLPVNVAFVPNAGTGPGDAFLYVTELYGAIKVMTNDGTVSDYANGLLNFNPTGNFPGSGEQGLTGIAVDPNTGDVYAAMLYDAGGPHYPKVVRFTSSDGGLTAATETTILDMFGESQGQSHQISHLTLTPAGRLLVHMGDGFDSSTAQNLNSYRGKILRCELDGSATTSNPFYNAGNGITARDYVYAYGVRNPFAGAWRESDGFHYEAENGPSVDRLVKVVPGHNYGWDGSNGSMFQDALYTWNPAHAPVNMVFLQPGTFAGSGFPANYMDRLVLTESGPTYASGPQANGKRLVEFVLDGAGNVLSGPETLVEYSGTGRATAVGLAAGPDGLYFTELYADQGSFPIQTGARLLRVRFDVGGEGCNFLGTPYCGPAVDNSTGAAGALLVTGSEQVADQDLTLTAIHLPTSQFGYFLTSLTQAFVQNPGGSQGNLCLGGTIGRFAQQVQSSGAAGSMAIAVDVTNLPAGLGAIQPGETWNFQCWFRDANPGATSNFTQGVAVDFQ